MRIFSFYKNLKFQLFFLLFSTSAFVLNKYVFTFEFLFKASFSMFSGWYPNFYIPLFIFFKSSPFIFVYLYILLIVKFNYKIYLYLLGTLLLALIVFCFDGLKVINFLLMFTVLLPCCHAAELVQDKIILYIGRFIQWEEKTGFFKKMVKHINYYL